MSATTHVLTPRRRWLLAFAGIVVLALTLRVVRLDRDEVRTDEGNYAIRAIGWNDFMFSTVLGTPWVWFQEQERVPGWTQLSFNDHPPLHFATIWLSAKLFGIKLWAVRLPSALYGAGSVAVLMLLLRRWGYRGAALAAGLLLSVLPWHVFISRQAIQESGVIFWIAGSLLLADGAARSPDNRYSRLRWVAVGVALAAGLLTKYSAALVLLPLAWLTVRQHWFHRRGFWFAPGTLAALLLPLGYYNWQLYVLRGHFDLQLARLLGQDTSKDWPASHQALWQGDARQILTFAYNQARGLTLVASASALIGWLYALARKVRINESVAVVSIGTGAAGAALALVTLNDFGRSAVLLPFYILAFGVGVAMLPKVFSFPLSGLALAIAAAASLPALSAVKPLPQLAQTFWSPPVGFSAWESWREQHIPTAVTPRHYSSLLGWFQRQIADAAKPNQDFVVLDNRISWFPINWYFFRYGWYADNATFVNAGIFAYLNWQNVFEPRRGLPLWYVEVGPAAMDSKGAFDEQTRVTHLFFSALAKRQNVSPQIVTATDGRPLLKIWRVNWDRELDFPPPGAVGTRE
ncbi:MAG: glycosyltransferase family 39 protein [bacterium]|nr:glycosyltransferase family 39 protein [bacterium]